MISSDMILPMFVHAFGADKAQKRQQRADELAAEREIAKVQAQERVKGEQERQTKRLEADLDVQTTLQKSKIYNVIVRDPTTGDVYPVTYTPPQMPPRNIVGFMNEGTPTFVEGYDMNVLPGQSRSTPVYTINAPGVSMTGTNSELTQRFGLGWELTYGLNHTGFKDRVTGEVKSFSLDDRKAAGSITSKVTPMIDGVLRPDLPYNDAVNLANTGGNELKLMTQSVLNATNSAIGEPSISAAIRPERLTTIPVVDDVIWQDEKGVTQQAGPFTATEFAQWAQRNKVNPQDVERKESNLTIPTSVLRGNNGKINRDMFELGVQNNVVYKYPRDKEITKTLNTIFLPQGTKIKVDGEPVSILTDITLAEATPLLAEHGLNLSMVTYQPQKVTFKNGEEIRREDDGALRQPVETEQHVVVENQKNGKVIYHPFLHERQAKDFANENPNAVYVGTRTMKGDVVIKTTEAEEDGVDDLLQFPPGSLLAQRYPEGILRSEATQQQIDAAATVTPVKVKIDPAGESKVVEKGSSGQAPIAELRDKHDVSIQLGNSPTGVFLGPLKQDAEGSPKLVTMHEKLSADNLKVINSVQADEYVRVIGPIIATSVTKIINDAKLATAGQGEFADSGTAMAPNTNPLMYVKKAFPSFLRVKGMSEFLSGYTSNTIESQEIDNESLLGDIDGPNSNTMSTAISADPENADDDLDTAGGIVANADQYTFANVTGIDAATFAFVNHKGSGMLFNMFADAARGGPRSSVEVSPEHRRQAKASVTALIRTKMLPDGRPFLQNNARVALPSSQQVMLGALRTLNETPSKLSVGEGDNARPVSLLQTMAFGINSASGNPDLEDHRIIANAIIPASGSLEEAVNAVLPFIHTTYVDKNDISPTSFMSPAVIKASRDAGLINPSRLTEQKRMADKATAEQTGELILTAQRIVRGYVDENGEIQSATAVGNLELRLLGAQYLFREGANVVKKFITGGETGLFEDFKSNIDSYIDHLATLPGMDRVKYNEDGRRQVEEIVDEIRDEYNRATTEAQRSMAVRQLNIVTLVYQLSSILQGGTGGKTISDNDVAILLRGMRQETLSTPEQQLAVIREIIEIAREMGAHAKFRSSGNARVIAAYNYVIGLSSITERGIYHKTMDFQNVAARFGESRAPQITDEALADLVNQARLLADPENYKEVSDENPMTDAERSKALNSLKPQGAG